MASKLATKTLGILFFALIIIGSIALSVRAQMGPGGMMSGNATTSGNSEEAEGRVLWDKFKSGGVTCAMLVGKDFDVLGEYFMGTMLGVSHEAMNDTLKQKLGESGETQIHLALGKRMSGCDTSAVYPAGFAGFMPMMGGSLALDGDNQQNGMMNFGYGLGSLGGILMVLLLAITAGLLITVVILVRSRTKSNSIPPQ